MEHDLKELYNLLFKILADAPTEEECSFIEAECYAELQNALESLDDLFDEKGLEH